MNSNKLVATISTGKNSAGLWVNEGLYSALCSQGAKEGDTDLGEIYVRIARVDEEGIVLDTFDGNILLKWNFRDEKFPNRWAIGRIGLEWNVEMIEHKGFYHPVEIEAHRLEYGKFLIPHPIII